MTIITHVAPDWDAITSVWLLKRYGGMADHGVAFVNTGNPGDLSDAAAVVDTGRELDAARLRFDHHQLPGQSANDTCAAWEVFKHVAEQNNLTHLAPLNALILNGDTGSKNYGAEWSRLTGIHALLSVRKARKESDLDLLAWGFSVLDDLDAHLRARYEARETLDQYTVYQSTDYLVRGLAGAPQGATFAAFEEGARLVVFYSEGENTVSVGAMRGGESTEPDCGALVMKILTWNVSGIPDPAVIEELSRWFRHPAGFFSGRGTAKAPDPTPLTVNFVQLCEVLDFAWPR